MLLLRVPTLGLVTRGNAKLGNASDEASFPREEDYYGVKPDDWPSRVEPEDWRIVAAEPRAVRPIAARACRKTWQPLAHAL